MSIVDFWPLPDEPGFREALLDLADEVLPGDLVRATPTAPAPVAVELGDGLTDDELRVQATRLKDELEAALGEAFAVGFAIHGNGIPRD